MKKFKMYYPFMANELKANLAYKGSFYLFIVCKILEAFIAYYLWMAIYKSSESGVLGGLTKNEMTVYIFMIYMTSNIVRVGVIGQINENVKDGSVVMNLIKPIDYRMSLIARAAGTAIYRIIIPGVFIWLGIELYKCYVLKIGFTSIVNILLYLVSLMCSFMIYALFDFCFGMIAFANTYMFGVNMVKNAILTFLSGELIPISFFPTLLSKIFGFLPFSSMVYTPVMIYLGKYNSKELIFALAIQFIWIIILYVVGALLWKKITKRLIVLGG